MPIEVQAQDGSTITFPDGTPQDTITGVLIQHFPHGPRTNAAGAAAEGFLDTAGLGFRDEVRGLGAASGLPEWARTALGGYSAIPGAARLAYEKLTGEDNGPAAQAYRAERDFTRDIVKQSQEEHPTAFGSGQVGGAVTSALTLPAFRAAEGAGMLARAGAAAKTGGLYGAAYGAGSAEGGLGDTLGEAAIGGVTGGILGGAASPVMDIAGHTLGVGAGKAGEVYQWLRSEANPRFTDEEAVRRILRARGEDIASGQAPQIDTGIAQRAGIPLAAGDYGGPATMSLMRSAANTEPQARGAIEQFTGPRFADQNERAANFIRELTGGANATQDLDAIKAQARLANRPAYERAYKAGDRPIWSPELERLTSAPALQSAMKSAVTSGQNRAVEEGFGAFNPPITVTPDGRIRLNRSPSGAPVYPNLQWWDYVQRDLNDMAEKVAGREPDKFRYLNSLHQQLNTELDNLVPAYQKARLGAWRAFQSQDALEAGQKFATLTGKNSDYARDIAKMTPADRELFARGYASDIADKLLKLRDGRSIDQAFLTSKSAVERHNMALGPDRARQLEAYLRTETVADQMRQALGNSTTARQLHELGLAAGGAGGAALGELLGGEHGFGIGAGIGIAAHFASHRMTATERQLAGRIGHLLASNDPRLTARAVQAVSRSPGIMDALRRASRQDFGMTAARAATGAAQSQVQQPAAQAITGQ